MSILAEPASEFVLLRDGGQALLRPVQPDDLPRLAEFFGRLSAESLALRFHSGGIRIDERTIRQATAGRALVAERNGRLVALGSYVRLRDPIRAEMALAVADEEHGHGIGTSLVERLAREARREGIRHLLAIVLGANRPMLDLLDRLGLRSSRTLHAGTIEVDVELREDQAYLEHADARRHSAARASLQPLFTAQSVAVVGASRQPESIGQALFRNLLASPFGGVVYPVNPAANAVAGVRAYPNVAAIGAPVDLAVIVVPAAAVLAVAEECLAAGVRALVVISAGFAETGAEGRRRQDDLVRLCRSHGVRVVGPNCMGVLHRTPGGMLNATFAPTIPGPGPVSIASQSGALGIAILEQARQIGLGIASFVSMGNKADVSSNDLLEQWEEDPATSVIALYLESFGNPRRFARVARRVARHKPIVVVKGGRTEAGQRAAASHTAALASAERAVDALFRQAGVLRCDTLEELFDVTTLLANQPLPRGNRVAILTNAGGLGILCSDACADHGLAVPPLTDATQRALRELLPADAAVGNPVDLLASATPIEYAAALRTLLADAGVDAVIVLFIPPLVTQADAVAAALVDACTPAPEKPVLTCFVGTQGVPAVLHGATALPSYRYPEGAARSLGHAAARAAWLRRPLGAAASFANVDETAVRRIVEAAQHRAGQPWLPTEEAHALLQAYGIPMPASLFVHSAEEAAAACARLGCPVAVKLVSSTALHKSDVGGVQLGIETPGAAAAAYRVIQQELMERGLAGAMDGALVQPMQRGGVECLVGVVGDPTFGPLIAFGMGGVLAEAVGDVAFRLHPLADVDADELIGSVKAAQLLRSYRGAPPADTAVLRELLLRVSQLVDDVPALAEMDLNPVLVRPAGQGVLVLDARLRLATTTE